LHTRQTLIPLHNQFLAVNADRGPVASFFLKFESIWSVDNFT
jgi:hypothetical protein